MAGPIRSAIGFPMKEKPGTPAASVLRSEPYNWRRPIPFAGLWTLALAVFQLVSTWAGYDNSAIIGGDIRLRAVSSEKSTADSHGRILVYAHRQRVVDDLAAQRWHDRNQPDQTLQPDRAEQLRLGSNRQFVLFEHKLSTGAKRVMRGIGATDSAAQGARSNRRGGACSYRA
jgi:hypothetical protein